MSLNPLGVVGAVGVSAALAWALWPRLGRRPKPEAPKPEPSVEMLKGYGPPSELFDVRTCAACRKATWVPKGKSPTALALCPECRSSVSAGPAEAKVPTAVPAPRLTWRERHRKATALAAAYRDGLAAHRRTVAQKQREAARVVTEADRADIRRLFEDWDARESEAIQEEMLDDLRPFYPDVNDEALLRIARELAKAPTFPKRGGSP